MNVREQLLRDIDDTRLALRQAVKKAREMHELAEAQRAAQEEMVLELATVLSKGLLDRQPKEVAEIQKLLDRTYRLTELRNQMEVGSFSVQVARVREACEEVLP